MEDALEYLVIAREACESVVSVALTESEKETMADLWRLVGREHHTAVIPCAGLVRVTRRFMLDDWRVPWHDCREGLRVAVELTYNL